jgi:integrase-like protein
MAELSPLRRRMIEDMTVRNMSQATQRSYISAVSKFSRYFGKSPERLDLEDVRAFQVHLVSTGVSWSSLNQMVCALRFFCGVTLGERPFPSVSLCPLAAQTGLARHLWRAFSILPCPPFELKWADEVERRMAAEGIVEAVDVTADCDRGFDPAREDGAPDAFGLEGLEERLDHGVVEAVCLARHRDRDAVLSQLSLGLDGAVLAATVRVVNEPAGMGAARRRPGGGPTTPVPYGAVPRAGPRRRAG